MDKKCENCGCACENCGCKNGKCGTCACDCSKCEGTHCQKKCCMRKGRGIKIMVAALLLASGPMVAGYLISSSLQSGATADKSIEVMVSAEKEVKADDAVWKINFQGTSNELAPLHEKYVKDRELIMNFLKEKGFQEDEIDAGAPAILDLKSLEWGKEKQEGDRYVMKARIKVNTKNITAVKAASKSTAELLKQGVILAAQERYSEDANPKYYIKNTDAVEQQLYEQATQKGLELAKQMSVNLGVKLKGIRQIVQDKSFEIYNNEGIATGYPNFNALKGATKKAKVELKMKFNIE